MRAAPQESIAFHLTPMFGLALHNRCSASIQADGGAIHFHAQIGMSGFTQLCPARALERGANGGTFKPLKRGPRVGVCCKVFEIFQKTNKMSKPTSCAASLIFAYFRAIEKGPAFRGML